MILNQLTQSIIILGFRLYSDVLEGVETVRPFLRLTNNIRIREKGDDGVIL